MQDHSTTESEVTQANCKPLPSLTERDMERFWSYVDKSPGQGPKGECWGWTGAKNDRGYGVLIVKNNDGKWANMRVPRLAFKIQHGEDPHPFLVRHECDWPPCVRGDHILKGTVQDNSDDAVERGMLATGDRNGSRLYPERLSRGSTHKRSKFVEADIVEIRRLFSSGEMNATQIAERCSVATSTICRIIKGSGWAHADGAKTEGSLLVTGERHHGAKVTEEIVRLIRAEHAAGASMCGLAKKYGLSYLPVNYICKRKTWKNVE